MSDLDMAALPQPKGGARVLAAYRPPDHVASIVLRELLRTMGRKGLENKQLDLLRPSSSLRDVVVYYVGDLEILSKRAVSIVGTREVSDDGRARGRRLARELAQAGVVIVSGLAKGVDAAAHTGAMDQGGLTVAVIGTPVDRVYPPENAALQEEIYERHLLLSPFAIGETVHRSNFPKRNRVMAAVSDGTVIVEASDTSGTLHQAAECQRLGRWLFILRAVVENPSVTWPARFLNDKNRKTLIIDRTEQIIDAIMPR